jgi:predicted O-methyltransferase YrrM
MTSYNLTHLTQDERQVVWGPIQDDEALLLYSLVRVFRFKRVLEIGGLSGYSARNFLEALSYSQETALYTCDINPVPKLADNHHIIIKDAKDLNLDDLNNAPIDLLFFDCHDMVQMEIYYNLLKNKLIDDKTCIALHDTNLHYYPYTLQAPAEVKYIEVADERGGFSHQPVERQMVNIFKTLGYDILQVSTTKEQHNDNFPFRHGISICKKFKINA